MPIETPSSQHPLPGELQQRVENALNQVTMLQAEEARLTKLISQNTLIINNLHEEERACSSRIETLKSDIVDLEKDVEVSKEILNQLESQKTVTNNELAEVTTKLQVSANELSSTQARIDSVLKNHKDAEDDISNRLGKLQDKEIAHELKVERLKKAIE